MPIVIVEDVAVRDVVLNEIAGAGWTIDRAAAGDTSSHTMTELTVANSDDARAAVLLALQGRGLLVSAAADRDVIDDLTEDLSRIGQVVFVDAATAVRLEVDTWRLAHALADGSTVSAAAAALHMSIRTANRRLTDAKVALGATTRAQLLRALAGPRRIPTAKLSR